MNKLYDIDNDKLVSYTILRTDIVDGASVPTNLLLCDATGYSFRCPTDYFYATPAEAWAQYLKDLRATERSLIRQIAELGASLTEVQTKILQVTKQH